MRRAAPLLAFWILLLAGGAPAEEDPQGPAGDVPEIPGLRFLGLNEWGWEEWLRQVDDAVMIRVPGGAYRKRPYEPEGEFAEPSPVEVPSFFIDKYEVTNERFARFMPQFPGPPEPARPGDPQAAASPPHEPAYGDTSDFDRRPVPGMQTPTWSWRARPERAHHPVTAATGFGAEAYARWAGGRLPTVDEWEKAAGGVEGRLYPWGDERPDATRANFGRPSLRGTMPAGSFRAGASPYGALDMAGNVYERVTAPGQEQPVVLKGGSWLSPHPLNLRVLDMCVQAMDVSEGSVGFRVVVDDPFPDRPTVRRAAMPTLRLATEFGAAIEEAQERRVPVFVSLQYDTCGQCDRFRAQEMRDPRFVAYANEHLVVLVGHHPGDAILFARKDEGRPSLYPGLEEWELQSNFRQGLAAVGSFRVSPGNFVLDPFLVRPDAPADAFLAREEELPKSGGRVDAYLAAFTRASREMAVRHGPPQPVEAEKKDEEGE